MSREPFNIGSRFRGARDREARRLGTKKVVEGVPLAKLIRRRLVDRPEIVMVAAPRSIHAEKFRRLKTTLTNLPDGRPQVMLVSSAVPKDGKSTISINLGLAFAADPEVKTLLIDADLRRGSVSRFVTPEPQVGLSHLLAGQATDDHAILELEKSRLHVLPSGELCRDPLELLGSSLAELIKSLRERYDCILIDTPPLVLFPDADAIGVHSDGALVVARVGHTDVSSYKLAVDAVTSTRILGVILNDVSRRSFADWGKYRGGYANKDYYTSYYREGKDEGKDEE